MSVGRRTLALSLVLLLVAGVGGYEIRVVNGMFTSPGPLEAPIRIQVNPGSSVRGVFAELHRKRAVWSLQSVEWYIRLHGLDRKSVV